MSKYPIIDLARARDVRIKELEDNKLVLNSGFKEIGKDVDVVNKEAGFLVTIWNLVSVDYGLN